MFKATHFEFRFRYLLHTLLFVLGFTAPWNYALHLDPAGPNAHLWGTVAANLSRLGIGNIAVAFDLLLAIAIGCAFCGAGLRTWGTAYVGAGIVQSGAMHTAPAANGLLQDGPFRYLRNPLYLGTFLHTLALSLLMPLSGGIFTIVAIGLLQVRLALAEEPYLRQKLGAAYVAYCALVPRFLPLLRSPVAAIGLKPHWAQAMLGEIYFWAVAVTFAVAGWGYNTQPLIKGVLIAFGLSLVARAFLPKAAAAQA